MAELSAIADIDVVIAGLSCPTGPPKLKQHRALIDRCFAQPSVEAILAALEVEANPFAAETLATLRTKSPTSLKISHRQIRAGRDLGFDDCMRMEWRMVNRVVAGHDFYEGTRAAIIDKDRNPRWRPGRLQEVAEEDVARYFAPFDGIRELRFDWEEGT